MLHQADWIPQLILKAAYIAVVKTQKEKPGCGLSTFSCGENRQGIGHTP